MLKLRRLVIYMDDSSGGICEKVKSKYSEVLARSSGYLNVLSTNLIENMELLPLAAHCSYAFSALLEFLWASPHLRR